MGLSQDRPIGPSQQANPQDSPPVAPRHPARVTNPHFGVPIEGDVTWVRK